MAKKQCDFGCFVHGQAEGAHSFFQWHSFSIFLGCFLRELEGGSLSPFFLAAFGNQLKPPGRAKAGHR